MAAISNLKISSHEPIERALHIIDSDSRKIALVVDENGCLQGTVTDGDLRKALLEHISLSSPCSEIMCRTPTVASIRHTESQLQHIAMDTKHVWYLYSRLPVHLLIP